MALEKTSSVADVLFGLRPPSGWTAFADASFSRSEGTWAVVVLNPSGEVERAVFFGGRCAGSHEAETKGLLAAVAALDELGVRGTVYCDALGVVEASGRILGLLADNHTILWVPREQNQAAHLLAGHGMTGWREVKNLHSRKLILSENRSVVVPFPETVRLAERPPAKIGAAIIQLLKNGASSLTPDSLHRSLVEAWPDFRSKNPSDVLNALGAKLQTNDLRMLDDGRLVLDAAGLPALDQGSAWEFVQKRMGFSLKQKPHQILNEHRSILSRMVASGWADSGIIRLGPLLERMAADSPSAATFFEKPGNVLQGVRADRQISSGIACLAVTGGRPIALLPVKSKTTADDIKWLLGECGFDGVKNPRGPVFPAPWLARNLVRIDRFLSGKPVPSGALVLLAEMGDAKKVLVPRGDLADLAARYGFAGVLAAQEVAATAAQERQTAQKDATTRVLESSGAIRADLGLGKMRLPGPAQGSSEKLLTVSEAWALLGLEPAQGRRAAEMGLIDLVRVGGREFVGTQKVTEVFENREEMLALVLAEELLSPWEAGVLLGVSKSFIVWLEERRYLKAVGHGSSRRADWSLYRRGSVLGLKPQLRELLREAAMSVR